MRVEGRTAVQQGHRRVGGQPPWSLVGTHQLDHESVAEGGEGRWYVNAEGGGQVLPPTYGQSVCAKTVGKSGGQIGTAERESHAALEERFHGRRCIQHVRGLFS